MSEPNGDRSNRPNGQRPQGPNRVPRPVFGWLLFIGLALIFATFLSQTFTPKADKISIDEFWTRAKNNDIEELVIRGNTIVGRLKAGLQGTAEGSLERFELKYPATAITQEFFDKFRTLCPNAKVSYDEPNLFLLQVVWPLVPFILLVALIWFFIFRQLRNAGGGPGMLGNFGRSRHRISSKEHTNVTFADVAGIEEAKEEVTEIIEFLRNPKKFQKLGGRIPRGVLLVGDPGCGKTLLAKAIAGEADVPFFSISGSDFVEMFVGVGASRVRDLFKQAKDNSPCIIFLDEIDAVGRRRGASFNGGGHDEREQTLNAILVEMDGFDTSDQVIVIAATNRVDVLDPALIRPGRFDRQVHVPLPDIKGRLEILKVHAKKVKLGPDVDLHRLARTTPMFSGADLAAIINESALIATLSNKDYVEMIDLDEARDKVRWGRARKSRVVDEHDRLVTAYHEAGHAVVQALLPEADPLHKVSIIPRAGMGGATFSMPERDRMVYGRKYLMAMLQVTFGGRIAEDLFCDDISSGASMDIRQATDIARSMVTEWGMNERVGFVFYGDEENRPNMLDLGSNREYSEKTAELIDQEVKALLDASYRETQVLIEANREKLEAIAQALLKYETLTGAEVETLLSGRQLDKPSVSDLLDAEPTPPPSLPKAKPVRDDTGGLDLGPGTLPQPG